MVESSDGQNVGQIDEGRIVLGGRSLDGKAMHSCYSRRVEDCTVIIVDHISIEWRHLSPYWSWI